VGQHLRPDLSREQRSLVVSRGWWKLAEAA
jgi:hypothetical protein